MVHRRSRGRCRIIIAPFVHRCLVSLSKPSSLVLLLPPPPPHPYHLIPKSIFYDPPGTSGGFGGDLKTL